VAHENVRVLGVDTPELRGACDDERALARVAQAKLRELLPVGARVELRELQFDKYGRSLADVWVGGARLSELLIGAGVARPYDGGKREGWC
jgi:micrococcal nuclease